MGSPAALVLSIVAALGALAAPIAGFYWRLQQPQTTWRRLILASATGGAAGGALLGVLIVTLGPGAAATPSDLLWVPLYACTFALSGLVIGLIGVAVRWRGR